MASHTTAQTCMYGILGEQEVNIRDRTTISPAFIGSNANVFLGVSTEVGGDIISGGGIFMSSYALANSNVHYASALFKQEPVYILGNEDQFDGEFSMNIPVKFVDVGTENVTINPGSEPLALPPGNYGDLQMNSGATLILTGGVYNFNRFIVESGDSTIIFDSKEDFIEINAQQTLRFGDRNVFELTDGTNASQVQFYSNTLDQIKIGTDTTFTGVITAPYAQIYAFSRTHIVGNLLARSVWIDIDSTVQPVQNCSDYNLVIDTSFREDTRDTLSFESDDKWTLQEGSAGAEISLSTMSSTDGDTCLEVSLNNESVVNIEAVTSIKNVFTEDATDISISLDVYSNAVPFSEWGGEISIFIKAEDDQDYILAGTSIYDRDADDYSDESQTVTFPLTTEISDLIINNFVNVMIQISTTEPDAVFWLDRLRFCDNNGGCNMMLPSLLPEENMDEDETVEIVAARWNDEDNEIMEDVPSLGGSLENINAYDIDQAVSMYVQSAYGDNNTIPLGQAVLAPGEIFTFEINAADLPFDEPGKISIATVQLSATYSKPDGTPYTITDAVATRYYHHTDSGITHFNEDIFYSAYNAHLYKKPEGSNGRPVHDDSGLLIGYSGAFRYRNANDMIIEPTFDSDSSPDTDSEIDTDTIIVVE